MKKIILSLVLMFVATLQVFAYTISVGDEVAMVANKVKVRSCARTSCSLEGNVSNGDIGNVTDGPKETTSYYWWEINWDNGITGWTPTPKNDYSWYYEKPKGLYPGGSSSNPEIVNSNNPTLRWNKIDGVHHYMIVLINEETENVTYYDNISLSKTSYTIPDTLQTGKRYSWSIIPYDDDNDMGLKADYIFFDVKKSALKSYDLTIRPDDITVRSASGNDDIINVGEKFDIRVIIRNIGDLDSSSYRVKYEYKSAEDSSFTYFDTDSDSGIDAGESHSETSDDENVKGGRGTHYVRVCVYNNDQDADHNNDCGLKSFNVKGSSESGEKLTLSTIAPNNIKSSLLNHTITLTGTNFTSNMILEFSLDNKNFRNSKIPINLISSNQLTFDTMVYSKTGYIYYRLKNGNNYSNSIKLTVLNNSNTKPKIYNTGKKSYAINSGERIASQFMVIDTEDFVDTWQNKIERNFTLNIDWGDGNKNSVTQSNTNLVVNQYHTYNTPKTEPYTITIQAIDSDGAKSIPIRAFVKVKGSSSHNTVPIKNIAIGDKVVAKDPCYKSRAVGHSIDKATGAENFSITPLKVKGLFDLPFTLQYNSLLLSQGDISKGWSHNYTVSSYIEMMFTDKKDIRVYWDNSAKKYNDFNLSDTKNVYTSTDKATQDDILTYNENDETYTLKRKNGTVYTYDGDGYLKSISNYKNQKINIIFDENGKLSRVEEPISGVSLRYYYNSDEKLDRVKDSLGRLAYLQYNENGLLSKVEFPDETDHYFFYNDNDQMYKREVRKIVDGEKKKVQIFHLYYIDDARVSGEEDGNDNLATFTYKTEDNKIYSTYVNKARKKTETTYNATNLNPEYIKYPDGTTEEFTYYSNGKIKTKKDRAKHTTQYFYDNKGNMNRVVYDDNSEEQYEYDDNRNIIVKKIIDKNKKVFITHNTYDGNNLIDTKLPNNEHITYTYNDDNQMTSKTVGGKTTKYRYYTDSDSSQGHLKGLLREVETPEGLITSYTYDKAGRLVTETNPQGGVTTYTYDDMDRVKVITNPDNKTKTYEYDMMGNKTQEKDFNGNITKYEYDNNGNLVKKIDALNHEYRFEYDSADRLKKSFDPLGYYVEYDYDSMGRVKETIDKRGNHTTYNYDAMGNLKEEFDPYGNRLYTKTYDAKNNLIKVVDALNHTTTTDYTVFGKPSKITDPLDHITEFKYDKLGRLEKVINAKQQEATQSYNPTGTLKQFTDAGENTTKFTYDDDGNLLTTTTASNSMTQNIYEKGLLKKFINGRKDTKTLTYDKLNRVKEVKDKDGTIVYTYDNNGNLLTITENGKSATYTYDKLDRVTSYTDINGNKIKYDYDEVGNLKKLYYPDNHYIEYKYDKNSNLTEVKEGNLKTTYEYDKNNRLIKLTRPNKTVMTRTYKSTGQLETQTDKTSSGEVIYSVTFEYDEAGNIKSETRVPPLKPNLPINLTMSYKKGNLLKDANQTQAVFDDDDNMVSFGAKTYSYDSRNRLIQDNTATYSYDSQNHRVAQTINGKTTTYTINPNTTLSQLLELKESNGNKTTYIYGLGLLYQKKDGKRLYYHYDLRGSTIALTDENGNIVDRFSYLPFGGKISHDLGNTQTPFLYNGRDGVMSDISGLYYMRARYYDPTLRRFINRDTLLGEIGEMASLNRFAYVNGNPVSGVDPSGNRAVTDYVKFNSDGELIITTDYVKINTSTISENYLEKFLDSDARRWGNNSHSTWRKALRKSHVNVKRSWYYSKLYKQVSKLGLYYNGAVASKDVFYKSMDATDIENEFMKTAYMQNKDFLPYIVEHDKRALCGQAVAVGTGVNSVMYNEIGVGYSKELDIKKICYPKWFSQPSLDSVDSCSMYNGYPYVQKHLEQ